MKTVFVFLYVLAFSLILACKTAPQESSNASSTVPEPPSSIQLGQPSEATQKAISQGLMGDSTMFPYVYQGEGRTNWFEAYTMRFQLEYEEPLYPMTNFQTPWLKPDGYSEQTGIFVTYIRNGREVTMTNPYITVQYIRRDMPYTSTIDSIYLWLDDTHLNRKGGTVLHESKTFRTASQVEAVSKEYTNPGVADVSRPSKYIAYAYLPYDKDYIIGFALTCSEPTDFEINQEPFYNLVRSFQYK